MSIQHKLIEELAIAKGKRYHGAPVALFLTRDEIKELRSALAAMQMFPERGSGEFTGIRLHGVRIYLVDPDAPHVVYDDRL